MGFIHNSLRLLVVITAVLLASCIDSREEIWIHADGSGRVDMTYSLPAAAARLQGGEVGIKKLISDALQKSSAIQSSHCEVTAEADRLKIHVTAAFGSVLALKKSANEASFSKMPAAAKKLRGDIKLHLEGLSLAFSRTISVGEALPGVGFLPASNFKDRHLIYILHLPVSVSESNATVVSDGGRTLTWDFPLALAIKEPIITRFKAKIPVPVWLMITLSAFVVLAIAGLVYGIRKFRRRRSARLMAK